MRDDLAPAVAEMLLTGDGISAADEPGAWVDVMLDRWPDISAAEIQRGFEIAIEMQLASDAERAAYG